MKVYALSSFRTHKRAFITTMSVRFHFGPPRSPPSAKRKAVDELREELYLDSDDELEHLQDEKKGRDADFVLISRMKHPDQAPFIVEDSLELRLDPKKWTFPLTPERKADLVRCLTTIAQQAVDDLDSKYRQADERIKKDVKKQKKEEMDAANLAETLKK
jgi:hypothetical protein